ncbi:MAG: hypothetical protein ACREOZ_01940 [Gloeomargaritales cyanobacterium]
MDDIYRARNEIPNHSFPDGVPLGPWKTHVEGLAAINAWSKDPNSGGGAFAVKILSAPRPTSKVGPLKVIGCDRSGAYSGLSKKRTKKKGYSKRTACPWNLTMELTTVGWVVRTWRMLLAHVTIIKYRKTVAAPIITRSR